MNLQPLYNIFAKVPADKARHFLAGFVVYNVSLLFDPLIFIVFKWVMSPFFTIDYSLTLMANALLSLLITVASAIHKEYLDSLDPKHESSIWDMWYGSVAACVQTLGFIVVGVL